MISVGLVLTALQAAAALVLVGIERQLPPSSIPVIGDVLEFIGVDDPGRKAFIVTQSVIGLLFVVLSYGFWRLRRWAWVGVMLTWAITLSVHILAWLVSTGPERWSGSSLVLGVVIVQVFYLNRRGVQARFRARRRSTPGAEVAS